MNINSQQIFRAGPSLELLPLERMPHEERVVLMAQSATRQTYGICRASPEQDWRAVDRDTALLLFTLRTPGRLPGFVEGDKSSVGSLKRLVLDGILEVQQGESFVSVAAALDRPEPATPQGVVDRLTRQALEYGSRLDLEDAGQLAARLYFYHRYPATPHWMKRLDDPQRWLGIPSSKTGDPFARHWQFRDRQSKGWLQWRQRRIRGSKSRGALGGQHLKLYVSPGLPAIGAAFAVLRDHLHGTRARAFKIGADACGLLRPDKMVVYFDTLEDLSLATEKLAPALTNLPAHGVPFSAEISRDGMLSWGIDAPLHFSQRHGMQQSWRLWLVTRLAQYLLTARRAEDADVSPVAFALGRLELDGVDPRTWAPAENLWQSPPLVEA